MPVASTMSSMRVPSRPREANTAAARGSAAAMLSVTSFIGPRACRRRGGRGGGDVEVVDAPQDQRAPPFGGRVEPPDVGEAANQPVEDDLAFESGQIGAQAVVDARSKAQRVVGVAGDVEALRVVELGRVAVRGP